MILQKVFGIRINDSKGEKKAMRIFKVFEKAPR